MKSPVESLQHLENELNRYKTQLEALNASKDYENHEEKRTDLRRFYEEKICGLQARIDTEKARNIKVKGANEVAYSPRGYCQAKSTHVVSQRN